MGRQITTKKLAKNMTLSLVAQLISLAASFVFGMIVPRYIDVILNMIMMSSTRQDSARNFSFCWDLRVPLPF